MSSRAWGSAPTTTATASSWTCRGTAPAGSAAPPVATATRSRPTAPDRPRAAETAFGAQPTGPDCLSPAGELPLEPGRWSAIGSPQSKPRGMPDDEAQVRPLQEQLVRSRGWDRDRSAGRDARVRAARPGRRCGADAAGGDGGAKGAGAVRVGLQLPFGARTSHRVPGRLLRQGAGEAEDRLSPGGDEEGAAQRQCDVATWPHPAYGRPVRLARDAARHGAQRHLRQQRLL